MTDDKEPQNEYWILEDAKELMQIAFRINTFDEYIRELRNILHTLIPFVDKSALSWVNIPDSKHKILYMKNPSFVEEFKNVIMKKIQEVDSKLDPTIPTKTIWAYNNVYYGVIVAHGFTICLNKRTYIETEIQRMLIDLTYYALYKKFIGKLKQFVSKDQYINPVTIRQAINQYFQKNYKFNQYTSPKEVFEYLAIQQVQNLLDRMHSTQYKDLKYIHNYWISNIQTKAEKYGKDIGIAYLKYKKDLLSKDDTVPETTIDILEQHLRENIHMLKLEFKINDDLIEHIYNSINAQLSKETIRECIENLIKLPEAEIFAFAKNALVYAKDFEDMHIGINDLIHVKNKLPNLPKELLQTCAKNVSLQTMSNIKLALAIFIYLYMHINNKAKQEISFDDELE